MQALSQLSYTPRVTNFAGWQASNYNAVFPPEVATASRCCTVAGARRARVWSNEGDWACPITTHAHGHGQLGFLAVLGHVALMVWAIPSACQRCSLASFKAVAQGVHGLSPPA